MGDRGHIELQHRLQEYREEGHTIEEVDELRNELLKQELEGIELQLELDKKYAEEPKYYKKEEEAEKEWYEAYYAKEAEILRGAEKAHAKFDNEMKKIRSEGESIDKVICDSKNQDSIRSKTESIGYEDIEQATEGVRMPEIDAETQAIRTEITQEKDNSMEERE